MIAYFLTDQGQIRNHNEDAGGVFKNEHSQLMAVVADGMGGHRAGDVASKLATSQLHNHWKRAESFETPEQVEKWIRSSLEDVNRTMLEHAQENEECYGMGTTVVIVICTEQFVTVAHVGDSRCYVANENGFSQITEDHSLVNELVRTGQISREEAELHPRKNVLLRALGTEQEIHPDIHTLEFEPNDRLLLCSDGLSNKLEQDELSELATFNGEWPEFCQKLVRIANDRGGEDNITMAVIHYASPEKEGVE